MNVNGNRKRPNPNNPAEGPFEGLPIINQL
jgi:hypothetical protein